MEEGLLDRSSLKRASCESHVTANIVLSSSVAACGYFAYGFAIGYSSPAQSGIMDDLGLSIAEYSVFASILTFGGMIGALLSGRVADIFGRRMAMWLSELFFILGWCSIIFGKKAWWLDAGRLLIGVGAGIQIYVTPIYISEVTPKNIRGYFEAAASLMLPLGLSLVFYIGNYMSWHTLALVGIIPCFVQVLGVFFIPESPRWLAHIGLHKEVEASLQCLRGKDADISVEAAEIKDYTKAVQQTSGSKFMELFSRKYAHPLIVGMGLMALVQFGGANGISSFASSIFREAGCATDSATRVLAIIQLPFAAMSIIVIEKAGRRPLMMITSAGACLGCFLAALGFLFKNYHQLADLTASMVLTGILVFSAFFSMGLGAAPWIIMSEILPINIKGSAGSLMALINWFTSWLVSYGFNFLFQWNAAGVFFIFAFFCGSIVLFVATLLPETKGRTLEEIQASMTLLQ